MRNFWNNENHTFHKLPVSGRFELTQFVIGTVFILTMFIGIGQIPMSILVLKHSELVSFDQLETMKNFGAFLGKNYFLFLVLFAFALAFLAILFSFKYIHKAKILPFFTTRANFDWGRVLRSFGIWFLVAIVMLAYSYFTADSIQWNFNSSTFFGLLIIAVALIPLQIASEELLFRSYLFKGLSFLKKPILQLIICGILFGLMHMGNPEIGKLGKIAIVYYIWTGIFLGLIAHFDNGLEITLGYHFANNLFAAIILTNNWQAFQTDALFIDTAPPTLGWDIWISMFVLQPLYFLYFNKKYNWGISLKK